MESTNRPIERNERIIERNSPITNVNYHDRVRWGPILAGLVITLSIELILSGMGAAMGFTTIANSGAPRTISGNVGSGVGIWSMISLLISLFIGGLVTSRAAGSLNRNTALLNGGILWATTLALSAWLLSSGVSGVFGLVTNNASEIVNQVQQGNLDVPNNPGLTAQQTKDLAANAAKVGWTFALGSLLGLISSLAGASAGAHNQRTIKSNLEPRVIDTHQETT